MFRSIGQGWVKQGVVLACFAPLLRPPVEVLLELGPAPGVLLLLGALALQQEPLLPSHLGQGPACQGGEAHVAVQVTP